MGKEINNNIVEETEEMDFPFIEEKTFTEEDILSHLRFQFPSFTGTKLVINKLFDNKYSLNYWGKKKSGDCVILIRKLVKVENLGDTLRVTEDPRFGFNELIKLVK